MFLSVFHRSNNFQQAYSNILTAEELKPKGLFIEKAKLHWAKSENDSALSTLKRGIEQTFPTVLAVAECRSAESCLSKADSKLLAKVMILIINLNNYQVG